MPKRLALKLTEAVLGVLASAFICTALLGALYWGTANWWLASCIHAGPAGFACRSAALYNAWWWLALVVAVPLVALLLLSGSTRDRR